MTDVDVLPTAAMAVAIQAAAAPELPAVVSPHGNRTFAELNANANRLTRALRRRGLAAGDAVALLCSNRAEFAETWAACMRGGFRLTPLNFHFTAAEAGYIIDNCDARALVADARFAATAAGAAGLAPQATVLLAVGGDIDGFESYEAALAAEEPSNIDDPVTGTVMYYTSGTTGRPKGVHRSQIVGPSKTVRAAMDSGYERGMVNLCTGPLYHAAPMAVTLTVPLSAGATVVMMDGWDAEETLRLIERHRVTHTHLVPTMFHRLLALPEQVRSRYDLSSLRSVFHGAAPCPVAVKRAMIEWWGPIFTEYFAATEGGGTLVDSQTWLAKPGTVGKPDPPDFVLIADEDANPLPPNQPGLVWFKAPASGRFDYYKDDGKTAASYRGDYFTLGDMAYADDDGFLFITDRTADLVISGGVNIYPAEVDAVLLDHPAVADVATIGVPNAEWGEEVKAVVELKPGAVPSEEVATELISFCRERLAHYKCPRSVDFVDKLPRQDSGKIYKRLLRERYRQAEST